MAPTLDLTDVERFNLMKFRRNVADCCTLPHHDDQYLLRWLRARKFNAEAAEKMLRDSMKWREKWDVDNLVNWEPPEVIKKYYPSGLAGYDKDGSPVVVIPFAGIDMWGMLHSAGKADFIRMTIKMIERYLEIARRQAKEHGAGASKVSAIIDMENFNLRQYAWRPAGETVLSLIQMYEANYPEVLKTCFIINAPKIFAIAFSVVKNFLNDYTISKIQIYKNDPRKYQPVLLEVIDAAQLPKCFGGEMTDPDGNPACPSKVHPGGKIPKTYYQSAEDKENAMPNEDFMTVVVKKGDKLKLPFIVAQEGSFLRWEFRTDGHDIKFGVSCQNADGKDNVVIPTHRVRSHLTPESGVVNCAEIATYTVLFDNSYSFLRSKKLHYSISVAPPIKVSVKDDGEVAIQQL
ncbi:SEC14-like protein 2 [Bacillus rossius redtenbacheri]|uniref:SEC14-like protein 2 n=1 Tax=Bacillus rossius redtenbacheri TaxID=93214 RepID=UPI002FDE9AAA